VLPAESLEVVAALLCCFETGKLVCLVLFNDYILRTAFNCCFENCGEILLSAANGCKLEGVFCLFLLLLAAAGTAFYIFYVNELVLFIEII
jgi:hypothetical protein